MARRSRGVEVEGLAELRRAIRQTQNKEMGKELRKANAKIAESIIARALPRVPVGPTGNLKKSVRKWASQSSAGAKAGNARVPYGPPIHWGWPARNIKARPFLYDAAAIVEKQVTQEYTDAVQKILNNVRNR